MMQRAKTAQLARAGQVSAPLLIMAGCIWLLSGHIDSDMIAGLPGAVAAMQVWLCMAAVLFCILSFWAVARYDVLAHRHLRTRTCPRSAAKSGFAAIAIAQTAGFGVLTGAAVRWRMMRGLGLAKALMLSTFVSITFMTALAFVTSLAVLVLPSADWMWRPALLASVGLPLALCWISFAPGCAALRHKIKIPSLRTAALALGWTALDVTAAAIALFLFVSATDLSFAVFLPAFLLALGAAMLSGAPGGVGPFELMLVSLLPQVPMAELLAGIVMFRVFYYALPALLGVALVFLGTKQGVSSDHRTPVARPVAAGHNPELGILSQNGGQIFSTATSRYALWTTPQTATLLFDPLRGRTPQALSDLSATAQARNLVPFLYKCNPATALAARKQGWHVVKIAEDYVVDLDQHDVSTPRFRTLRRKCRKAAQAGVEVVAARALPHGLMAEVDAAWQSLTGPARGCTMGRYCPQYLTDQRCYLAYQDNRLIAFVSFHVSADRLCLDLMRHGADVPDGTMHLLVQTALSDARTAGIRAVSLAAVPTPPAWMRRLPSLLRRFDNPGLRQFKSTFAPKREPRYAAARSWAALFVGLGDIASLVHRPPPLSITRQTHNQCEDYEVALS
ncbi:MAG: phosphatidylglycerol lysyltransferase domain-containing protein [Sulfitobacter sp.]